MAMDEEKGNKPPSSKVLKVKPSLIAKSFEYCVCKGLVPATEKYFTCSHCEKKYHFNCLKISD